MLRCHAVSLGCPKNRVDTEHLLGMPGLELIMVDEADQADFIFINTCGFIRPAVEESIRSIVQAINDIEDITPRPLLVVGGCMVGRYTAEALAPDLPEVDLWLDNRDLTSWPARLAEALGLPCPEEPGRLLSTGPSYAWLKISDGCRHQCSFCTIPFIRGAHRSYGMEQLTREARNLLDQGVKELVLVAQDLTAWGQDLAEPSDLRRLLDVLLPLDGLHRLRLMYLYPSGLNRDLLTYLRQAGEPFVPYFDVPLQHAHSEVLGRMGRPFARNPMEVVSRIREIFPEAALRTSMIVGFPGETEEQFETLHDFARQVRFRHLGIFAYEAEEGTAAVSMSKQVSARLKEERRAAIMRTQAEISEEDLAQFMGQRLPVLVDAAHPEWPGLHIGRTWFQAPEIDGHTYISGPGVKAGALIEADIVETREYDLTALA